MKRFRMRWVAELMIHKDKSYRLWNDQLIITTKRISLYSIWYVNPWEKTDRIFLIKNTDDENKTFETGIKEFVF